MKKLSNIFESIWADIQDRSSGDVIRREDDLTNLKDLVPVEMGVSVLWADKDLEMKDGDCYFEYDTIENFIKKSDWRIPTKNEVYELMQYTKQLKNTDEVYVCSGDFDDGPELVFNKRGLKYADDEQVYAPTQYHSWTSTPTETKNTYYMNTIKHFQLFSPMYYRNRLCVRLVKDKK